MLAKDRWRFGSACLAASSPRKEETRAACATPGFVLRYDQIGRIFETLMLRLSKKTDYALMAMKHLASDPRRRAASAREIAETYDIQLELMAKVLTRLVRPGVLISPPRGRGG